jgi:hypothetical protein
MYIKGFSTIPRAQWNGHDGLFERFQHDKIFKLINLKKKKKNPLYESMDSNTHGCNMLIFIVFSSSFGS